jgi:hypothetical protein
MNENILKAFSNWAESTKSQLSTNTNAQVVVNQTSDNSSVNFEIDSNKKIGKLTLWESSDCHYEVLDVHTETTICEAFMENVSEDQFDSLFSTYIQHFTDSQT